jgi:hypothetical protein
MWLDHGPSAGCWLTQVRVTAAWVDFGKEGIHGNDHMMMLEKNSDTVAARN